MLNHEQSKDTRSLQADIVAGLSAYLELMATPRPTELSLTVLHPGDEPARLPGGQVHCLLERRWKLTAARRSGIS